MCVCPLQNTLISKPSIIISKIELAYWAAHSAKPFDYLQMTANCSANKSTVIPVAAFEYARPLQNIQPTFGGSAAACARVPWASIHAQPLENTESTTKSSFVAMGWLEFIAKLERVGENVPARGLSEVKKSKKRKNKSANQMH